MVAKIERVQHVDDVMRTICVLLAQLIEQSHLDQSLMMEAFLVADDLDGDVLAGHVIDGAHHLAEAALADDLEDLVAIRDVIVHDLRASEKLKGGRSETA